MKPTQNSPVGFLKFHILPFLAVFLIPCFSLWFFRYVEQDYDQKVLDSVERAIETDQSASEARKAEARMYWRNNPASGILASAKPEAAALQSTLSGVSLSYAIFRWNQRIAWVCLITVLLTLVIVGVSVIFSFRSQRAQYWSLRVGWSVLRTTAFIEVLGQGILVCFLSYWVTAFFFERISLKLIIVLCILAGLTVLGILRVMFRRVDDTNEVEGQPLSEENTPELWERVRDLAAKLGTAPPDRIVAGIQPNFFVTEQPVQLGGKRETGRTLYLSLPMLKTMSIDEADSVLGHELAHFSGEDTLWSRRISPLLLKFAAYLHVLSSGLGLVVGYFLHAFWKLYMLSIGRLSREREFRADHIGAGVSSVKAMSGALIKVCSYCEYRAKSEFEVIEQSSVNPDLRLAERIGQGFPGFLKAFVGTDDAVKSKAPHPFDTHPPLDQRLQALGLDIRSELAEPSLQSGVERTWNDSIPHANEIEDRLWTERQALIQKFHSQDIAWRIIPLTPEQIAQVTLHFPTRRFTHKDGSTATLDYHQLALSTEREPIAFASIESVTAEDTLTGGKRYTIVYRDAQGKKKKAKVYVHAYTDAQGTLTDAFVLYYGRHKTAEARSKKIQAKEH